MPSNPVDRALEAVFERDNRLPTSQASRPCVVREQAVDLARRGRTRSSDSVTLSALPSSSPIFGASSPTEMSTPLPRLSSSPMVALDSAAAMNPSAVSATYVKSRRGVRFPSTTSSRTRAWLMIVGMMARSDWRGPNVLNGRTIVTGTSNAAWKLAAMASDATLLPA